MFILRVWKNSRKLRGSRAKASEEGYYRCPQLYTRTRYSQRRRISQAKEYPRGDKGKSQHGGHYRREHEPYVLQQQQCPLCRDPLWKTKLHREVRKTPNWGVV